MPKLLTRIAIVVSLLIIVLWAGALTFPLLFPKDHMDYTKDDGKISIVATIYPLAFFASNLDPSAEIVTIVGPGVEPHEYEPTIGDMQNIQDADLVLTNGHIDEWAIDGLADRNGSTLEALQSLSLSKEDPHVWIDPVYAQDIVRMIGENLKVIDPNHADIIEANVQKKVETLAQIDAEYKTKLAQCQIREIVTAHDAFGFLESRYNFVAHGITGINPEEEPSPAQIAQLTDLVREHGITTVFFEELTSDALAKTLAEEADVAVDVLDPIENIMPGEDVEIGYTKAMDENLQKLINAMVCEN